jgi:eukaryotic-like serine/threonine-protein kinase
MKKDLWQQAEEIFHTALKLPEDERAVFLQKCNVSDDVRREVASLLANERAGEHLLESPALEVAARMMADKAPILTIGQTLSHYQIKSQLGKGGMGEVYRAHDSKLGRDVAIKSLPPEFERDPDRVARFNREARLLASLNHPNIAAIHGLEESGETQFLVLELVEGETLAEYIAGSAGLPGIALAKQGVLAGKDAAGTAAVQEILKLALQIAEALEAAHEKGVIHRDLKPANIKVTPDGKAKVLDFGLAKAFAGEQAETNLSNSPTLSGTATQQGLILGTAAYMSPEQARGKPVDKRADIWAFGCVLYEMLTGQALFQGEDVTEILASVVKGGVNLDLLPANLHPRVREAITRCLQRDLSRRYQDIRDAQYEIEQALANPGGESTQPVATTQPQKKPRTMLPWIAATAILGVIIGGLVVWKFRQAEPREVARFEYDLPEGQQFSNLAFDTVAISRDGKQFAYSTPKGLYLRRLDESGAKLIAGTEGDVQQPFFSPDGKWVGYLSVTERKLKKIPGGGGAPLSLCDVPQRIWGAWWNQDDMILYGLQGIGIMRVSASAGNPECIVKRKTGSLISPQVLPDGKSLLYTSLPMPLERIVVQSPKFIEGKELFKGMVARYLSSGHIVYMVSDNFALHAVPFDLDRLEATGKPVPVLESVSRYDISDSGTLVYIPGSGGHVSARRAFVWVDREGKEVPLSAPPGEYSIFRISPDGKRVALAAGSILKSNIYIWDTVRETLTRLIPDEGTWNSTPLWTPDGKRLVYASRTGSELTLDILWKAADGTGEAEKLASASPGRSLFPCSWSGDGKNLVLSEQTTTFQAGIDTLSMEKHHARKPLLQRVTNSSISLPRVSGDGRWIAYASSESGQSEVYVRPFPDVNTGKWILSNGGGHSPLWSPDGRELFYRNGDATMVIPVETEPTFKSGKPAVLFRGTYIDLPGNDVIFWDISPDGKRFLMLKGPAAEVPRKINVVLNWTEELKQRVPVK